MKITTSDKYTVKQILRWLWQAWRGNRLQAALNALLGVADVVLSLAQVWAVKHAIDVASGSDRGSIYWAVGIMGALILLNFAVNISGVWVRNLLGVRAQNRMQQATLQRILQSEWHSREHFHSGDVLNRLELDVPHRDVAEHALHHTHVRGCFRLHVSDGQHVGTDTRGDDTSLCACKQSVRAPYAPPLTPCA